MSRMAGTDNSTGSNRFKLKKDLETEVAFFKELSINLDLLNDKMPSNEELVNRSISTEDRTATDRSGSIEELQFKHKKM